MDLPKQSLHRFVPLADAMDYVLLGWMPRPSLQGTHHGDYSVHIAWLCECRPPRLTENNLDAAE